MRLTQIIGKLFKGKLKLDSKKQTRKPALPFLKGRLELNLDNLQP